LSCKIDQPQLVFTHKRKRACLGRLNCLNLSPFTRGPFRLPATKPPPFRILIAMFARLLLPILVLPMGIVGYSLAQDSKVEETTYLEEKEALLAERERLNQTVWKNETLAQLHEQSIVKLWDALLEMERKGEGDPYDVFAALPLHSVQLGKPAQSKRYDHAIEMTTFEKGQLLDQEEWKAWL